MPSTQKQTAKSSFIPPKWKKEECVYTGDHLIDAYLMGKQDGRDEAKKILAKQFKENINIATAVSEKLFATAAQKKMDLKKIYLKADGITKFSALLVAKKNDFISDKFREMFVAARKFKDEVESDSFYISFSFMPDSKSLSEKSIHADGYFLEYDKD